MGIFLAIASQKGGVGKTTIAVNLGFALVRRGWRVLLVDADIQGGLGFSLTEKSKNAYGFFDILMNPGWEQSISRFPISTSMNQMDLITRGSRENIDRVLMDMAGEWATPQRIWSCRRAIESLGHHVVIFDTSSGINSLGMSVCGTMDYILAPESPSPLCTRSLPQMLRMLSCAKEYSGGHTDSPVMAGFVFSMVEWSNPSTLEEQKEFRDLLPRELVLDTVIPRHPDVVEATRIGVPVGMLEQNPGGPGTIFEQLAVELEPRLGLNRGQTYYQ